MYLIAQVFTLKLAESLNNYSEQQPLREFEKRKDREKNIFVAKLMNNDAQMDIATSNKFVCEITQSIF